MIVVAALLGLAFGSFVNAWVWRVKTNKPVVKDRSMCPKCKHELSTKDLIPLLSWLWLRGKCRYCQKPISFQYPLVELLTAVLFVLSYVVLPNQNLADLLGLGIWLLILTSLIAMAVYDLKWMILPDSMMRALMVLALLWVVMLTITTSNPQLLLEHSLAALAGGGFFLAFHAGSKGKWMGGGDVKLAFGMGLLLGPSKLLVALMLGFNLAAIISLALLLTRRLERKDLIPFGPFLIAGTVLAVWFGQSVVDWYLNSLRMA